MTWILGIAIGFSVVVCGMTWVVQIPRAIKAHRLNDYSGVLDALGRVILVNVCISACNMVVFLVYKAVT